MNTSVRPPRVAAIHDLSGFGKCSLTVALPVLSACGVEVTCLPTAVLSTHTGGLTGYTFRDLTDDMTPTYKHWKSLDIPFDALYSGYLGSLAQIDIVRDIFNAFRTDESLILVDPVMADNGKLYPLFTHDMARGMAKLSGGADIVVPNLTEAAFMLGEDFREGPYTEGYLKDMCKKLCALGPRMAVLTGVYFKDNELGACCYDARTGEFAVYLTARVPGSYHGTGDVYGSVLLGALLNGYSLANAMKTATDFTYECILRSHEQKTDNRYGVDFERGLWKLGRRFAEGE